MIKPADKGGAVVVWRKDLYQKEAEQQLSNECFYTCLETDRTDEINTFIKNEMDSMIFARHLQIRQHLYWLRNQNVAIFIFCQKSISQETQVGQLFHLVPVLLM